MFYIKFFLESVIMFIRIHKKPIPFRNEIGYTQNRFPIVSITVI